MQDLQVLRHSCWGAILMVRIMKFPGTREAASYQATMFCQIGTPTNFSKWEILEGLWGSQVCLFSASQAQCF